MRSVVGRFLEHSRIFVFGRDDREQFFIGSADFMERNLDRRVEAIAPVLEADARARLRRTIEIMLEDDRRAWQLAADDRWTRVEDTIEERRGIDTFEAVMQEAQAQAQAPATLAVP